MTAEAQRLFGQKETASTEGAAGSKYSAMEAAAIRREGKTFRNLIAGIDTKVSDFFSKWRNGRISQQGEKLEKLYLAKLSASSLQTVSDILGYDIDARDVIVTSDDVKHIFDHHGDAEGEVHWGNLPLEQWAFDALPDVVTNPDSVAPGKLGKGKKNAGKRGILISKSFPNGNVVTVQFDNKGRGTMEITTMYVKENSGNTTQTLDMEQGSPQLTSVTTSGPVDPAIDGDTTSMLYGSENDPSAVRPERMEPVSSAPSVNQSAFAVKGDILSSILFGGKRVNASTLTAEQMAAVEKANEAGP